MSPGRIPREDADYASTPRECVVVRLRRAAEESGGAVGLDRINQYRLYELASALREMVPGYGDDPMRPSDARFRLVMGKKALLPYCSQTPPVWLSMSLGAARELVNAIDKMLSDLPRTSGFVNTADPQEVIEPWQFGSIRAALERFEAVLSAECEARPAFVAPRRGIYDTEELVNAAAKAIPAELRPFVSDKANAELDSAGRCLAFGLFTAAGFHMCRAVEAVLEEYYRRFTGKAGTLRSWHDYIDALGKAVAAGFKPKAEAQTLTYLNQLRDSSRNPIMHPRVSLSEADAFMIFSLGKGVICRMGQEIFAASKPRRRRKAQIKAVI